MNLEQWFDTRNTLHQIEHAIADQLQHTSEPMTLNAFYVMHYLAQAQGKPLTVNEISAYIGLSQSATSRMLHRFETSCQVIEKHKALQIGVP